MHSLEEYLNLNAAHYPEKAAFIYEDRVTGYRELYNRVNRLCNGLEGLGIVKGDRVAVLSSNRPEYFEAYCAGKTGLILVPLNIRLTSGEIKSIINNSGAETLIFEQSLIETVEEIKREIPGVRNYICIGDQYGYINYEDLLNESSPQVNPSKVKDEDIWCILYTAGTTGVPKGAMLTHRGMLGYAETQVPALKLSRDDVTLHVMPFFHVGGIWYTLFPCFTTGMTNIIMGQFKPDSFLRTIQKYGATRTFVVATMVIALLEEMEKNEYDVSTLNTIQYAASPMPVKTLKHAMKLFPKCRFFQQYGCTEAAGSTLTDEDHRYALEKDERLLSSCGRPWEGTEIAIFKEKGAEDEIGEVGIRTSRMMLGYWKNEEETSRTIRKGWVFPGDMGWMDKDGYLFIADRKKDMIVTGGENVYPTEVENVLYSHPAVLEAAVFAVSDNKWVEAVKAVVQLRKGMHATEKELIDFCKSRIAGYKCPKSVDFTGELPKSAAGKVLRRVLRERYSK